MLLSISTAGTQPSEIIKGIQKVLRDAEGMIKSPILHEFKSQFENVLLRKCDNPLFETEFLWNTSQLSGQIIFLPEILKIASELNSEDIAALFKKIFSEENTFVTSFRENLF